MRHELPFLLIILVLTFLFFRCISGHLSGCFERFLHCTMAAPVAMLSQLHSGGIDIEDLWSSAYSADIVLEPLEVVCGWPVSVHYGLATRILSAIRSLALILR